MPTTEQQFKVDDLVTSNHDFKLTQDIWYAKVIRVQTGVEGSDDGCMYVTAGKWGKEPKAKITTRQLYSQHLQEWIKV